VGEVTMEVIKQKAIQQLNTTTNQRHAANEKFFLSIQIMKKQHSYPLTIDYKVLIVASTSQRA